MLGPLTDQWEQEGAAFSFFSWAGSVLSQKHAWSSDVSLDEESVIKCLVMKLLNFRVLICWVLRVFCWVSVLERQDFPISQYCSPRGNVCAARTPCTALYEPGMAVRSHTNVMVGVI